MVSLALAGVCLIWGEVSLGCSFRVALPEGVQPLVTRGIYRFTRNPLALSVDLLALGVLFLAPSWLALISLVLNVVAYDGKIRIEEAYLREAHGARAVAVDHADQLHAGYRLIFLNMELTEMADANDADLDRMRLARAVGQHALEDDVGRDQRGVGGIAGGLEALTRKRLGL